MGFLAIAGFFACGSRSELRAGPGQNEGGGGTGGTGGTTASTTTTSSSSTTTTSEGGGGTGGMPIGPCAELSYEAPFSHLDGGMMAHQRSPRLAYSSDDGLSVTLASGWEAAADPPNPVDLRHTSIDPWIDFPEGTGFGPTNLAAFDAGVSFSAAQSTGKRFALLFRDFQSPPPGGLRFSADYKPKSGDVPASLLVDPQADDALFLTRGESSWLYGAGDQQPNQYETRVGVVHEDFVGQEVAIGCTGTPALADAVVIPGGFMTAVSATGAATAGCDAATPSGTGGPTVFLIGQSSTVFVTDFGYPEFTDLVMAPRKSGAWIVWYEPLVDASSVLYLAALDEFGMVVVPPFSFAMPCEEGTLAAAGFEDFLMVSCVVPEPEGASPHVQVFDPDGVPRGKITVAATGQAKGRVALLGSPISRAAVLAWSETASIGDQIRVTRVDCIDKE